MRGRLDEIDNFVCSVFGSYGSCLGYCKICEKSHPGCGGDKFNKNGKCPDKCEGSGDTFLIAWDWQGRQVGKCCFEKVFRPFKKILDGMRNPILEYYAGCIKNEKEELTAVEALFNKTVRNK